MIRFCWQCPESGASEEHSFFTRSGLIRISGFGYIDVVEFYSCLIGCWLALTPTVSTSVPLSSVFTADSVVGESDAGTVVSLFLLGALLKV